MGHKYDRQQIRAAIVNAFSNDDYDEKILSDIAFHMTDWLSDLQQWESFCADPSSLSDEEIAALLSQFLIHVPNHIVAAAKLTLGYPVTDIFGIGAVQENVDED